jgi:hypothetical protein
MAYYTFRICQGSYSSDVRAVLANDAAAWHEGSKVCGDLILTSLNGGWKSQTNRAPSAIFSG